MPAISVVEVMKKYSDEYFQKRQNDLSRFVTYCLASESIKQDQLFEEFINHADMAEYKKVYTKLSKQLEETQHLSAMVALP